MSRYKIKYNDGSTQTVSRAEYAVSLIPKGTPVRWRKVGRATTTEGTGILMSSWMCQDVICAEIDCDGTRVGVLLFDNARVWRLKDASLLPSIGSGI